MAGLTIGGLMGAGSLLNGTGIGNNVTESQSANFGLGFGMNQGSSWNKGEGSSWGEYGSEGSSYDVSDSFSETNGSAASGADIMRAYEANKKQYEFWKNQADYNASEAQKQRDWQELMSNTAYQRTVKDLIKAGLNPYLAATSLGGASTPSGAVASSGLSTAHKAQSFPDQRSESHSEGQSQNSSWGNEGSANYSVGGSNNYGINFDIDTGSSNSKSEPALGKIITDAVKTATNSTSAKAKYDDRGFRLNDNSSSSFKGFDGSGYDPAY